MIKEAFNRIISIYLMHWINIRIKKLKLVEKKENEMKNICRKSHDRLTLMMII